MSNTVSTPVSKLQRPACAEDETLLFQLFALDRVGEFISCGIPPEEAMSLVEMQYQGSKMTYQARYPHAVDSILFNASGAPVGRLLIDRRADCWRIVDIAVLPEDRRKGLATEALKQCQELCKQSGSSLTLQVSPSNPALRLYERLEFRIVDQDTHSVHMLWSAADGVAG